MIEWSRNQAKLIMMAEHPGHTYLVHGPVRSGKSMPAVFGFCRNACTRFAGHDFIIASRSAAQLESIIVTYMREFAYEHGMLLKQKQYHYVLNSFLGGGAPNRFWPFIGNDKSSAYKVSGPTMAGSLIDEVENIPQAFVNVCRERSTTTKGKKNVLITNPGGPHHWMKKELIDNADGRLIVDMPFTFADNPILGDEEIREIETIYPPGTAIHDRRVKGEWTAQTGMVYPHFEKAVQYPPREKPDFAIVSIDHAESSVSHALRFEIYSKRGGIWCAKEWFHDHRVIPMDDTEQALAIIGNLNSRKDVLTWYCDPAAPKFANKLSELTGDRVEPAQNSVAEGIQKTAQWMANGTVYISPDCERLIDELNGYIWDEKAADRGEDKPVKYNDHGCDALRYFCYSESSRLAERTVGKRIINAPL